MDEAEVKDMLKKILILVFVFMIGAGGSYLIFGNKKPNTDYDKKLQEIELAIKKTDEQMGQLAIQKQRLIGAYQVLQSMKNGK